ncbi:MAG TPA: aminotransferase class I/II-fold pyridoxal phosphate-dependent enzyme, partial [bacterium]|nr:aminotransferase class I/II-fold pyridoxal phosphate-dependent enzyme [bacterium]
GFAISQAHNCQLLEKFLAPNRLSRITCAIVDEVFKSHHYVYENAETLVVERGRMFSKMQTIEGVRVFPSEANFLLFRMDKAHEVARLLQNDGFLIRNVDNQTSLINCLRVTIGSPEQNDAFLLTLKKVKNEVKDL